MSPKSALQRAIPRFRVQISVALGLFLQCAIAGRAETNCGVLVICQTVLPFL